MEGVRSLNNICIAYEPIWAIGTGETAKPEQINDIHKFIRDFLSEKYSKNEAENISILYGGSVNSDNASDLISINGVNGFLIGGASLDVAIFSDIVKIVSKNYMR
jgi:triosephosphate isomerase